MNPPVLLPVPRCSRCKDPAETGGGEPLCAFHFFQKIALKNCGARRFATDLRAVWKRQEGRCAWTGVRLVMGVQASLDHGVPLTRGGTHRRGNFYWVTKEVNRMKGNLTEAEFLGLVVLMAGELGFRVPTTLPSEENESDVRTLGPPRTGL